MGETAHLRVCRFEPGAVFEGALLGVVERMEAGGEARLLDALFVRRDAETGALEAVDLSTRGAGGTLASLLDFRLDPGRRRKLTERTLVEQRELVEAIGATLAAGAALFAVLDTAPDAAALEDAVARCNGRLVADEPVDARALAEVGVTSLVAAR